MIRFTNFLSQMFFIQLNVRMLYISNYEENNPFAPITELMKKRNMTSSTVNTGILKTNPFILRNNHIKSQQVQYLNIYITNSFFHCRDNIALKIKR